VGTLFGHAAAQPRYYAPRPVYIAPQPAYYVGQPRYQRWVAYCSAKYRSFNPATGYFVGHDGAYHPCRF
jgi:hypothetical protein